MATIGIDGIIDSIHGVEDTLSRFANRFFKSLQVLIDGESENPYADNSNVEFTIPIEFYAQCYTFFQAYQATNDYNRYDNGYQPVLFSFDLSLDNGDLSIDNFQCLGKLYTGSGYSNMWRNLSDSQKSDLVEQMKNYFTGNLDITSDYSSEPDVFTYSNGGMFNFRTRDHSDSLHFEYNSLDGVKRSTRLQVSMLDESYSPRLDTDTDLISPTYNSFSNPQTLVNYIQKRPFQMITREESWAINWVTTNDAVHNYVDTHTTAQGTFKVYYGDNYIIYYIPQSVPLSYNTIKNVTITAVNKINSDNPTQKPITVPTYEELKFDETDKNHTKPMVLNKFVPDANGMVYYYELDKNDVWKVRAGLNTINLDPLVLKDVTKNLISYKLFAFNPTTLIKTKTPVIVHIGGREIKYNDASIPANYVEELNTIQLGSITINKLFGDYRDYAPYTKIELFVPFCGWTTLPSWCIDTTITGEMFVDMWNGSCKATIKASALDAPDGVVVCEMGGVCAYDVPFVADATGAKAASMLSKVATTAGAVATGNPLAIATSGISLATALNENYTRMMGVVGDGSNINGLDHMFVKLTRVSWTDPHKKARPNAYRRVHGIPCGKQLTLSEGDGFTQINDADITGAMTDKEKQMIIDGFRHGLIL